MQWLSPCRRRHEGRSSTAWIERPEQRGIAEPAPVGNPDAIELVACGHRIPDHEIRIIDDTGRALGERKEGRLEFRGPSATSGYFQNPVKTRELFDDGWLDTGDRVRPAAVSSSPADQDIIRAGRHIAPHEIEEAVGAIPGLQEQRRRLGVADPASGTGIVVLAETDEAIRRLADLKARTRRLQPPSSGPPVRSSVRQELFRPRAARSGEPRQGTSISEGTWRRHSARCGGSWRA
jgi:acyl-CoA synthetase (AMP-forming)/AMP-acid ligase II